MALLALVTLAVLGFAGVPLITMSSRHFEATGATTYHVQAHWPLVIALIIFLVGVALLLFSRRENAA